jgi:hypothetical protein
MGSEYCTFVSPVIGNGDTRPRAGRELFSTEVKSESWYHRDEVFHNLQQSVTCLRLTWYYFQVESDIF